MLKKIDIEQIALGMYVHSVCGSWFDNPFWSNSFKLATLADLARLKAGRIRHVWIDTARGGDVPVAPARQAPHADADGHATPDATAAEAAPAPMPAPVRHASTAEELLRAADIVRQSPSAVAAMFADARMGQVIQLDQAGPVVEQISASVLRNSGALISLIRLKQADDYTYLHSVAVCAMMISLARQIGLDEQEVHQCGMAGLLHDVGKMGVPLAVLNKPDKLTDAEFAVVRGHPGAGHAILMRTGVAHPVTLDVCLHHHERIDGAGYPHGLKGDQISLHARMGPICDVYDAITSNRPYKQGWSPAVSLRRMAEWTRNGHLDSQLFAAFVKCIGIYPVGTLVRLRSQQLAVVIDNSHSLLAPVVRAFFSVPQGAHTPPQTIDLHAEGQQDGIASYEDEKHWDFGDLSHYWL